MSSWGRTDKVVTLHIGLVARRYGRVTERFRAAMAAKVCRFIDGVPDFGAIGSG